MFVELADELSDDEIDSVNALASLSSGVVWLLLAGKPTTEIMKRTAINHMVYIVPKVA